MEAGYAVSLYTCDCNVQAGERKVMTRSDALEIACTMQEVDAPGKEALKRVQTCAWLQWYMLGGSNRDRESKGIFVVFSLRYMS